MGVVIYELCCGKPPFLGDSMQQLFERVNAGKYTPIPSVYSGELSRLISSMLKLNPKRRPSAQELLDNYVVDYSATLKRKDSDPQLLATIKVPRDMLRLKAILPNNKYKNAKKTSIEEANANLIKSEANELPALRYKIDQKNNRNRSPRQYKIGLVQ